ncbi:hypothetical protein [Azospirillum canadense]|uniref:hypothetical protein n=1 Tax=Azospirillum canadense TaxID=403962 RepID=UPI002227D59E|nr:hypothetical protein [Azospirillum canadense]MCW2239704.1 hypothetical protein [Azospirillum canadense]
MEDDVLQPDRRIIDRVRQWLWPHLPYVRDPHEGGPCPRAAWQRRVLGPMKSWPGYKVGVVHYPDADQADADIQALEKAAFNAARRRQPWWRRHLPTRWWR